MFQAFLCLDILKLIHLIKMKISLKTWVAVDALESDRQLRNGKHKAQFSAFWRNYIDDDDYEDDNTKDDDSIMVAFGSLTRVRRKVMDFFCFVAQNEITLNHIPSCFSCVVANTEALLGPEWLPLMICTCIS